jgi:hypothetical protein
MQPLFILPEDKKQMLILTLISLLANLVPFWGQQGNIR